MIEKLPIRKVRARTVKVISMKVNRLVIRGCVTVTSSGLLCYVLITGTMVRVTVRMRVSVRVKSLSLGTTGWRLAGELKRWSSVAVLWVGCEED